MAIPREKEIEEMTNYFRNDLNGLLDFIDYLDKNNRGWRGTGYKYFKPLLRLERKYAFKIIEEKSNSI